MVLKHFSNQWAKYPSMNDDIVVAESTSNWKLLDSCSCAWTDCAVKMGQNTSELLPIYLFTVQKSVFNVSDR